MLKNLTGAKGGKRGRRRGGNGMLPSLTSGGDPTAYDKAGGLGGSPYPGGSGSGSGSAALQKTAGGRRSRRRKGSRRKRSGRSRRSRSR